MPSACPEALIAITLASLRIEPLHRKIRVINKSARNLHAELLLRLLGRERGNAGTIEAASKSARIFDAGRDLERPVRFLRRIGTFAAKPGGSPALFSSALLLDAPGTTIRRPFRLHRWSLDRTPHHRGSQSHHGETGSLAG